MDNYVIPTLGFAGIIATEAGGPLESVSAIAILGVCVYYFLYKFDRKMDIIISRTERLEHILDDDKEGTKND